ncbi:hypothetical protein D9M71_516010 [compost metagenome]
MAVGNAIALDPVGTAGGDVEQQVDQMIGQQVDLVDIKNTTVGFGQYAWRKLRLALGQRRVQVKRTDQALFSGAQWQGHERAFTKQIGQAASQRTLGHTARAFDQYATDFRIDGGQAQRELQRFGADHRRQRKMCRFSHLKSLLHRPAIALRGPLGSPPVAPTGHAAGLRAGVR